MNVSCPDCRSIFRVDPAKVPPAGVRARCSVCGGVISIPAPTGAEHAANGQPARGSVFERTSPGARTPAAPERLGSRRSLRAATAATRPPAAPRSALRGSADPPQPGPTEVPAAPATPPGSDRAQPPPPPRQRRLRRLRDSRSSRRAADAAPSAFQAAGIRPRPTPGSHHSGQGSRPPFCLAPTASPPTTPPPPLGPPRPAPPAPVTAAPGVRSIRSSPRTPISAPSDSRARSSPTLSPIIRRSTPKGSAMELSNSSSERR